jgi:hypothetical protein
MNGVDGLIKKPLRKFELKALKNEINVTEAGNMPMFVSFASA